MLLPYLPIILFQAMSAMAVDGFLAARTSDSTNGHDTDVDELTALTKYRAVHCRLSDRS
jgi:hypothetical protein